MASRTYSEDYIRLLSQDVERASICAVEPLQTDSFIARSAMQKAIRRRDRLTALRAAATLLELNPDALWRRLAVTGLEDIGVAEHDLFGMIIAAQGKRTRSRIADDWTIAATLVRKACWASKCQAANDLHNIAANDPALEHVRIELAKEPPKALIAIACDTALELPHRYAAAIQLLEDSHATAAEIDELFKHLGSGRDGEAPLYRQAFTKTRLGLAAASLILLSKGEARVDPLLSKDDDLTDVEWVAGVPAYALDQYTRSGRAALKRFISENAEWRTFARRYQLGAAIQLQAAGELLFRAEGALLGKRRVWEIGRGLYQRSATIGCFMPPCAVPHGLALIRAQLPALNRIRREVLG